MDNNFDNEYYGFEPQKPITERESEPEPRQDAAEPQEPQSAFQPQEPQSAFQPQPPAQETYQPQPQPPQNAFQPQPPAQGAYQPQPVQNTFRPQEPPQNAFQPQEPSPGNMYDFRPQKPLMQEQPQAAEHGFDPIQRTAVYDNNGFSGAPQQPPVQPQQPPVPYGQNQRYQGYYQQPQPPYYAQPQPAAPRPKKKTSPVLITIIVVMGVLLAASLFGLFFFALQTADKEPQKKSNSIMDEFPEFTMPYGNYEKNIPSTTAPVHDESDYSDKTDKNYGGLALGDRPEDALTNKDYTAENAFNAASPSVVSVLCYSGAFTENTTPTTQGSGIIISSDGFVLTNSHVIGNSKTAYAIKVVTADSKEYKAGVVGFDSRTDLAVLKLDDAKDLKAATFGDSEQIILGEDIIIIGNPGGIEYQNSMTKGVVSAVNRDASSKNMAKYIQTDAAINPGNSGGPAVNMFGQVIGIASAKISDEKYEGMGFCIPSAQAKKIVDSLIKNGYVEGRVKIGISGNAVTAAEAENYGVPRGIMVYSIEKDGPCDNTELKEDDIITAFDGEEVTTFSQMYELLEKHKAGDKVKLKFYRTSDNSEHEIEITLKEDK